MLAAVSRGRFGLRGRRTRVVGLRNSAEPDPASAERTRVHQAFLGRVVAYLCADAGIRQFVDWGCPVPGTAERIRAAAPEASVVHIAPAGTSGVLSAADTAVVAADGAGVPAQLDELTARGLLDLDEPVAVLMTRPFAAGEPPEGIADLYRAMRGGGYLVLSAAVPHRELVRALGPFAPVDPGAADITWWPYPDEDVSARGSGTLGALGRAPARRPR
nr:SAM-dependent methyltransferase [Nocardiopsis algeriensis]